MKKLLILTLKVVAFLIVLGVLLAIAGWGYHYVYEVLPKKKVNVEVEYSAGIGCSEKYPIEVAIENGSDRTIHRTSFSISIYRKGYSSNIAKWSYKPYYSTDKIISPGETHVACWTFPELQEGSEGRYVLNDLLYAIEHKSIYFGD